MISAISGSTFLNVRRSLRPLTSTVILNSSQVYSSGAMTIAIPSIGNDLKFTQADLAWPLQAYKFVHPIA